METFNIGSYPKIYALGHTAINELLFDSVTVEEKVDGSQFSMARLNGELHVRSKGAVMYPDAPEKMFSAAVDVAKSLDLKDGYIYRGEYLRSPKHNTLAYDRIPKNHIILFDICKIGEESYMDYWRKVDEAERLGLETVPLLYEGKVESSEQLFEFLERTSILGGQKIEGFVIKNYHRYGIDKKILIGKYVSEAFKEVHQGEWRDSNPTRTDILQKLIQSYKTPARWNKAIQHLKEDGKLEGSPRDIGNLIKEVQRDVFDECYDEIKTILFNHFAPQIKRGIVGGLPEWYKQELTKKQFEA